MYTGEKFVISGGGIGGLSAALALSRVGYQSTVLERAPEFLEIGAGIQIGPNGIRMIAELGILDEVLALSIFPEELVMFDSVTSERVTSIPLGEPFKKKFGYPYILIHRAELHKCLQKACEKTGMVDLLPGIALEDCKDDGNVVTATCSNGVEMQGVGLIGADGLWSKTREVIIGDGSPRVSGHVAYRAVLPTAEIPERLRQNSMVLWAGEKLHLVKYPLRGGEFFNLVAVFHSQKYVEGWDTYGDPQELSARFEPAHEDVKLLLSKIDSWKMWVLCDRDPIADWTRGRVTLLGDAAHPTLQYMGQGAIMAMEDAVCLSANIALTPGDIAGAFERYDKARYLRTGRIQLMSRVNGEVYHAAGVAGELRNAWLSTKSREDHYSSFNWLYDEVPGLHLPRKQAAE